MNFSRFPILLKFVLPCLLWTSLLFAQQQTQVDSVVINNAREKVLEINKLWYKNTDLALKKTDSLLSYVKLHNYTKGLAQAYSAYASIYTNKGESGKAMAYYKKSLEYSQQINHQLFVAMTQLNIASLLYEMEEYEEAIKYSNSLDYFESNNKDNLVVFVVNLKGSCYSKLGKARDSVHQFFDKGLEVARKSNNTFGIAQSLNNKASDDIGRGISIIRAKTWLEESLMILKKHHKEERLLTRYALVWLSEAQLALGDLQDALTTIKKVEGLYAKEDYLYGIKECYETKIKILNQLKRYRQSKDVYAKLMAVNKKRHSKKQKAQLNSLRIQYETEEQERAIESLNQKAEIQNLQLKQQRYNSIILGVISFLVMMVSLFIYLRSKQRQKQKIVELELSKTRDKLLMERDLRHSELKAIRSQMKPHFIYNALNSIQEYIITNEKTIASRYVGQFAMLMRIYLNHSQLKTVLLSEEIEALKLYLELEKLRLGESFTYLIQKEDGVSASEEIPSLLLQPYVENAIKHGLMHCPGAKVLKITFSELEEGMMCVIEDNGIGREQSYKNKERQVKNAVHRSFATQATQKRLDLINADLDQHIEEEIIDLYDEDRKAAGTKVVLKITYLV